MKNTFLMQILEQDARARCKWVRGPEKGGQGVSGSGDQDRVGKV